MASLNVKSVQYLDELRNCCLGNNPCFRPCMKKGFVNYDWKNHQHEICNEQRLNAAMVNNYSTEKYSIYPKKKKMVDKEEDVSSWKLDQWVKDYVVEILNNLDEAPFLLHIYSDCEEGSASTSKSRLVKEKAAAENWPHVKKKWGGGSPIPNGIILVEEMQYSEESVVSSSGENLGDGGFDSNKTCSSTKVWGILIQGKGLSFPACFILKTSRVRSVSGFCTHFCLVRVESFFETLDIQLKKLWLV